MTHIAAMTNQDKTMREQFDAWARKWSYGVLDSDDDAGRVSRLGAWAAWQAATAAARTVGDVGEPVAWRSAVLDLIDECPGLTMDQDHWLSRRVKELDFPSATQPAPAAVAVPLTYVQIIAAWYAQTDEYNQWDYLGEDEKIEWAVKCAQAKEGGTA